jgi:hypothetical protein
MLKVTKKVVKRKVEQSRKLTPFKDLTMDYMLEYAYNKMKIKKKDRLYSEDIYKTNEEERNKLISEISEKVCIDWFVFEVMMNEKLRKYEWLFEFLFNEMTYESSYYTESLHRYFETAYNRMLKEVSRRKRKGEIDKSCDWKIDVIRIQD